MTGTILAKRFIVFFLIAFSFLGGVPEKIIVVTPTVIAAEKVHEKSPQRKEVSVWEQTKRKIQVFINHSSELIVKASILLISLAVLVGLFLGLSDKAVFFYDEKDLFFAASPMIIFFAFFFLGEALEWKWLGKLGIILAVIDIILIMVRSFQYNPHSRFIAFCVGISKITLGTILVIKILDTLFPSGKTSREKRSNQLFSLVWALIFASLCKRLINGHRVSVRNKEKLIEGDYAS